jgi:nondiscriminating aspartyl-tRNA synthetase
MERVLAAELADHAGSTVKLAGWVHRRRQLKSVTFIILRDRSGTAQVVLDGDAGAPGLREETVVEIVGRAVANPQAPGGVEVHHPVVATLSPVSEAPPVELFRPAMNAGLATVLDHAAVTLRHPRSSATHRLAAAAMAGFRSTLDSLSFTEIQTPKIVAAATESGANVFAIDYFGTRAYLAQSPQFYKQMMVGVYERVYEVGPVFRAEPHDTGRHLAEYVSLDAELGFIADHHDVMAVLRQVVAGMVAAVQSHAAEPLALLGATSPVVPDEIPVIHFSTAQAMISDDTGEDLSREPDLAPAHERWLGAWAEREHRAEFLFVEGYPMVKRPFYTHPEPGRAAFSNSFDLLFRGQEIVTGGQRLHLYADYLAALAARREEPEDYRGYLEAFRYGMPPHGGFAIGLGRFIARLVGAANVREAVLFPRDLHRLSP